jgi:hypothetical protein
MPLNHAFYSLNISNLFVFSVEMDCFLQSRKCNLGYSRDECQSSEVKFMCL